MAAKQGMQIAVAELLNDEKMTGLLSTADAPWSTQRGQSAWLLPLGANF